MKVDSLKIPVCNNVWLMVYPSSTNALLFEIEEEDATANAESRYQLVEGCEYEYVFVDENEKSADFQFEENEVINFSKLHSSGGKIKTGIFVGSLELKIKNMHNVVVFEIRSSKTSYRTDYRKMIEDITRDYVDLVMQQGSPVSQTFEINPDADPLTLYQQFAFVRSVVDSDDFDIAIQKIIANPIRKWSGTLIRKHISNVKHIGRNELKQVMSSTNRIPFDNAEDFGLPKELTTLPRSLQVRYQKDTLDTPENRFVKYVLDSFYAFCDAFSEMKHATTKLKNESQLVCNKLAEYKNNLFFKQVSDVSFINFNNPVLQRKEGYREALQTWLMFDMAAKLSWKGGEELYKAGKKNVAVLYEYWLYFRLIDIVGKVFQIEEKSKEKLIQKDKDSINLGLRQGKVQMINGTYTKRARKLNVCLYYNRTFSHQKGSLYHAGTWTAQMRPDYTLSIWPGDVKENEAEKEETIVHVHFDAKYRLERFVTELAEFKKEDSEDDELLIEKDDQERGIYKRADLLKMHAYKDAIRRTSGAYVIYPGTESIEPLRGFHEIIPGLGAFCLRPGNVEEDASQIISFLTLVTDNLLDRISQRERFAYHQHMIYQESKEDNMMVCEPLPEYKHFNDAIIPDETMVAIGYAKSDKHIKWIEKEKLYNFRMGTGLGSVPLSVIQAKYLLIHRGGNSIKLYKIIGDGPVIMSNVDLHKLNYPDPKHDIYVVIKLAEAEPEFQNYTWVMSDIIMKKGYLSAIPQTITLSKLILNRKR